MLEAPNKSGHKHPALTKEVGKKLGRPCPPLSPAFMTRMPLCLFLRRLCNEGEEV